MPFFEVSNHGRLRSITRSYKRPHPRNQAMVQTRTVTGRIIIPNMNNKGYLTLSTTRYGRRLVHRAVIESFVYGGAIPDGLIVCHKDGNPHNNKLDNLYAGTYIDNLNDSKRHGTYCLRPNAKLTYNDAKNIRKSTKTITELSKEYGVCFATVSLIKRNITWKHA